MKNEPSLDKDLCPEQKALVKFLRKRGYDQIFQLNRAFAVLEYTCYNVHGYDYDALKVIIFQDPGMAEISPMWAWRSRHEVYIMGNKFGLSNIVNLLHDNYEEIVEGHVVCGKSREDWRKEIGLWPGSLEFIERSALYFKPHSRERGRWLQKFERLEEKLRTWLKEYDLTVKECKGAWEKHKEVK